MQYVIVGDTNEFKGALIKVVGKVSLEEANKRLFDILNNPSDNDKKILSMTEYKNIHLDTVEDKDCWWNNA